MMKTFDDLTFVNRGGLMGYQAILRFDNGYGVSVLRGNCFYSNGIDTYEVGVLNGDSLCYPEEFGDDVIGYVTAEQVTEIMKKVQEFPQL